MKACNVMTEHNRYIRLSDIPIEHSGLHLLTEIDIEIKYRGYNNVISGLTIDHYVIPKIIELINGKNNSVSSELRSTHK